MPVIDQKDVSPDEAILLGHCPECGQLLIPKTAVAHASTHWFGRDPNDPWLSEEARRRYKLIIDFAAARYNPALEERDSHRQGKPMSPKQPEPSSHDTRPFWIDQLYAGGIFCAGLTMLPDHLPFGIVLSAIGAVWLGYLRWGSNPMTLQVRTPNVLSVAVLCVAVLVMVYDVYDRHYAGTISTTADLRLAPFGDSAFFDSLSSDKAESFRMVCFSTDPSSCGIAARYREQFRNHWNAAEPTYVYDGEPDFNGIDVLVPSDDDRPNGAVELTEAFLRAGIKAHLKPITPTSALKLAPKEFAVWVGAKP